METCPIPFWDISLPEVPIRFALQRYTIKFERKISLPVFLGPYLRGIFGVGLKRIFCQLQNKGLYCPDSCSCNFSHIFRGHAPDGLPTYPPFIIKPFPYQTTYEPRVDTINQQICDAVTFDLILLGDAIYSAPFFCQALQKGYLEQRNNAFILQSIISVSPDNIFPYYDGDRRTIIGQPQEHTLSLKSLNFANGQGNDSKISLTLEFVTPTRFKLQGNYPNGRFSFKDMIRGLLSRYKMLVYLQLLHEQRYEEATLVNNSRHNLELLDKLDSLSIDVLDSDLTWCRNETFSRNQNRRVSTGGLIGQIVYQGQITEFLPLIFFGELFQLGEKTNYGMGEYITKIS